MGVDMQNGENDVVVTENNNAVAREKFKFSEQNTQKAKEIIAKYPSGRERSAVMGLLYLAQDQVGGWLPIDALEHVAEVLQMPYMKVYEVASFYSMYNLKPVGKYHVQVCATTPCWLRGANDVMQACEDHLQIKCGQTTRDGMFTISRVECLGACVDAPLVQVATKDQSTGIINHDNYENLDYSKIIAVLEMLLNQR